MTYIRRWAKDEYLLAETIFKAIIFSGVRQCGKTTLMKRSLPENSVFLSLDDVDLAQAAHESAAGFLMRYRTRTCIAIDEVQKVPNLFHTNELPRPYRRGFEGP